MTNRASNETIESPKQLLGYIDDLTSDLSNNIEKDLYLIPIDENINIIYSPLRKVAFRGNDRSRSIIEKVILTRA